MSVGHWNRPQRKRDLGAMRLIAPVLLLLADIGCASGSAETTAGAALVTSVIAVAISGAQTVFAWRQARIQEDQRFASVWPRLSFDTSVDPPKEVDGGSGEGGVSFGVKNKGVGPAVVHAFRVKLDGATVSSVKALIVKAYGSNAGTYAVSSIVGEVLTPGERVQIVGIGGDAERIGPLSKVLLERGPTGALRLEASVCYCSVFEQCWWVQRQGGEPVATPTCPRDPIASSLDDAAW